MWAIAILYIENKICLKYLNRYQIYVWEKIVFIYILTKLCAWKGSTCLESHNDIICDFTADKCTEVSRLY